MVSVKSHKRTAKNKVYIVRQHARTGTKKTSKSLGKTPVKKSTSSLANWFNYDDDLKELTIRYPGGAKYRYHDVPPSIKKRIAADPKATMTYVKNTFTYSPDNPSAKAIYSKAQKNRKKSK